MSILFSWAAKNQQEFKINFWFWEEYNSVQSMTQDYLYSVLDSQDCYFRNDERERERECVQAGVLEWKIVLVRVSHLMWRKKKGDAL